MKGHALDESNDEPMAVPKQVAKWTGRSSVPGFAQFLLAASWITLMGCLPMLLPLIEREAITKTQIAVGGAMVVIVFGGFFLFTNVVLFQSVHFDRHRPLTVIECIYLMAQVITTVGYGDITPAYPRGQLFVGLYVLGALFVIAMVVSDMIEHALKTVQEVQAKAARNLAKQASRLRGRSDVREEEPSMDTARRRKENLHRLLTKPHPEMRPLVESLLVFLFFDVCWICFFVLYPGEGKSWMEATYMSVITLSTVGFGWFTPVTEGGMIFGAFWMLFGTAALVNVINNFTALMIQMKDHERKLNKDPSESLSLLESGTSEENISELQFLRFGLLERNLVSADAIDQILDAFQAYRPKDGMVSKSMIKDSLEKGSSADELLSPKHPKDADYEDCESGTGSV